MMDEWFLPDGCDTFARLTSRPSDSSINASRTAFTMRHRSRFAVSASVLSMVVMLAACAGAPRQRPVRMGPVTQGADSVEGARRLLQGDWSLASYETIAPDGSRATHPVTGLLTYDEFGNLSLRAQLNRDGQPPAVLEYRGRAVIDARASMLRVEGVQYTERPTGVSPEITEAVSLDKPRHYQISGDVLTLSALDPATRRPTAVVAFRRAQ
jgi:hypothetical protein